MKTILSGRCRDRRQAAEFNEYLSFGVDAMRKSVLLVASFSTMAMLLTGCQSSLTGDSYSRDEARRVQTIRMGTIESLRPVKIEGTKTPIGGVAGAVVGGVGGSAIGGGRGSIVAAVIGAVAGGLVGSAAEEGLTRTQGVEIRSEEHTSELQSHHDLVCRLLLEKKKKKK